MIMTNIELEGLAVAEIPPVVVVAEGAVTVTADAAGAVTLLERAVLTVVTALTKLVRNVLEVESTCAVCELAEFTWATKVILTPARRATVALESTLHPVLYALVAVSQIPIERA